MKHLGDISKINGADIAPVDCITFGSPCQDLSTAGKRKGMQHIELGSEETTRSGLFMEAVRVIKEMRDATNGIYPTFSIWENVPGAFSSNKGEDFRTVLEELAGVAAPGVAIPRPAAGKWNTAGTIMGAGYSIAWRVLDAQYWGVPQRRRRISLVTDFRGDRAPEILFKPESLRGDTAPGGTAVQGTAGNVRVGAEMAGGTPRETYYISGNTVDRETNQNGTGVTQDVSFTLNTVDRHAVAGFIYNAGKKAHGIGYEVEVSPTVKSDHPPSIAGLYENHAQDSRVIGPLEVAPTISEKCGTGGGNVPLVSGTITTRTGSPSPAGDHHAVAAVDCRNLKENGDLSGTLQAKTTPGYSLNYQNPVRIGYIVRRLTPTECERLQGFPDEWTNTPPVTDIPESDIDFWFEIYKIYAEIKNIKTKTIKNEKSLIRWVKKITTPTDGDRYKALGNSIARPPWRFVLGRVSEHLPTGATLGSLFDGIGGFPSIWEEIHGKGTALWASEIEPFAIAVTKYHFKG